MTQKSVLQTDDSVAHKIEYPHNLLRNIAKEGALTEYILGPSSKAIDLPFHFFTVSPLPVKPMTRLENESSP